MTSKSTARTCVALYPVLLVLSLSTATAASPPVITKGAIGPLFSAGPNIQSGEWISIYGTNLAASTAAVSTGIFPTTLNGTSVTIDGKGAYLWYVSSTQLNLQAPDDTASGSVNVVVTTAAGSTSATVNLVKAAPSFSLLDSSHVAGIIVRSDGSGHFGGGTYDIVGPTGTSLGYSTVAARPGDTVVLYAVGLGPTSPAVAAGTLFAGSAPVVSPVTVTLEGNALTPSFAGLVGAGLYQINLTIPSYITPGDQAVAISIPGYGASSLTKTVLSIQAAVAPKISSIVLSPGSVAGGASSVGTVTLFAPAPSGGAVVSLSDNTTNTALLSLPPSVTVPAGATSATFTITTGTNNTADTIEIEATYGGGSAYASLTIQPTVNSQCATVGGYWYVTENGSITGSLIASGQNVDTETYSLVGGNNVNVAQTGCTFTYYPIVNSGFLAGDDNFVRTGTVTGNNVTVTGELASLSNIETLEEQANPGLVISSANVSVNQLTATGTISTAQGVMNLSETGKFQASGNYSYLGESGSYTYTITTTSTAVFTNESVSFLLRGGADAEVKVAAAPAQTEIRLSPASLPLSGGAERILPGLINDLFTKNLRLAGIVSGKP